MYTKLAYFLLGFMFAMVLCAYGIIQWAHV